MVLKPPPTPITSFGGGDYSQVYTKTIQYSDTNLNPS